MSDWFRGSRYGALIGYARRQSRWLLTIVVTTLLSSLLHVLQPWPLKILIDGVLDRAATQPALLPTGGAALSVPALIVGVAVASFALFLIIALVDLTLCYAWVSAGQAMVYDLAGDLLRRYLRRSLVVHAKHPVGDALERIGTDSYSVYSAVGSLLVTPAQQVVTLVSVGLIAWHLDPGLTLLTFGVAPFLAASNLAIGPRLKRRATAQREAQSRLSSFVHQTLTALPMVQSFASAPRNNQRFGELAESVVGHSRRNTLERGGLELLNGLVVSVGTAAVLWQAGNRVLAGSLSVGSLLVYLSYLRIVRDAYQNLFSTWTKLKTIEASLDRASEILAGDDAVPETPTPRQFPARSTDHGTTVTFDAVSFGYDRERPVLRDIQLEVAAGETFAIVGQTGAGKSTLVGLVPRLFDPWRGRVAVDGVDIREVTLRDLRERMSAVLQEPCLLPTSVADNIAFGHRSASREEVETAARLARADEFIRALPQGFDTILGERGVDLSGGQRQRIGIARALVRRSPLLILDEPTSALDAETEGLLFDGLERLGQQTTVILVAHRLATIRRAHRIAVLDHGQVVEIGTHQELLARDGAYTRLWRLAAGGAATS